MSRVLSVAAVAALLFAAVSGVSQAATTTPKAKHRHDQMTHKPTPTAKHRHAAVHRARPVAKAEHS